MLQRLAEQLDPEARVWTGSEVPAAEQGIIILGTPLGHDEFVRAQLELKSREHGLLLSRIPSLSDLQSAWALGRIHFHPKHFHPILTLSSNDTFNQDTFIQQQFHPMNFSSNDIFIQ